MKKTFLAGLATLLPIAITLMIVFFIVDFLTTPFIGFIEEFISKHETTNLATNYRHLLVFMSRLIVLILLCALIFILGLLGRKIFFSWIFKLTHKVFNRIPIIKTIYRVTTEISKNVFSEKKKRLFQGTVAAPFPRDNTLALGLLLGDPPFEVVAKKKNLQSVFIPTSPHPISGFLVMYQESELHQMPIETEDLFKFLISCGLYHSGEKRGE